MIDWSYDLLPDQERDLLRQVSVFAGGWTLESAEFMFGSAEALDVLAQLVSKSLVNVSDTPLGVRYSLHETIRQYAHEKLAESGALQQTQRRHADACLTLILYGKEHLRFTDQKRWVAVLEMEQDNIREALTWSLSETGDASLGLQIAVCNGAFWLQSRRIEGSEWIRRLLERTTDSVPFKMRGRAMVQYAYLNDAAPSELRGYLQGLREIYVREDPEHTHAIEILGYLAILAETAEAGTALLDEALALSRESSHPHANYWIHYFLGLHMGPMGWKLDIANARAAFEAFLEAALSLRDTFGQALAHEGLMKVAFYGMHLRQAADLARQAMSLAEQVNAETCILNSLHCLAEIELIEGRLDAAKDHLDACGDHNLRYGYMAVTARAVGLRMRLALARGDYASVRALSAELRRYVSLPDAPIFFGLNVSILPGLETLAALESIEGRHARVAQLFGAVEAERERRHDPWWPKDHAQLDCYLNVSRQQLGEAGFAAAWAEGRTMTLEQAIALALEE
jgi:hypothetical protein